MMYVLQVLTGRETEICGKLRRAGHHPHAGNDEPAQERGYGVSGILRALAGGSS